MIDDADGDDYDDDNEEWGWCVYDICNTCDKVDYAGNNDFMVMLIMCL